MIYVATRCDNWILRLTGSLPVPGRYMALGHASEAAVADGSSWEELLRSRLSEPLGMARTTAFVDEAIANGNYAIP